MLSVDECRKYIDDDTLSDKEVGEIRDALYKIGGDILSRYFSDDMCEN
jgi:hypothetical protein